MDDQQGLAHAIGPVHVRLDVNPNGTHTDQSEHGSIGAVDVQPRIESYYEKLTFSTYVYFSTKI
jgi:hypothetical protein